ncbi:hypothetical protein Tco_0316006 [Tanacetum coccineum]
MHPCAREDDPNWWFTANRMHPCAREDEPDAPLGAINHPTHPILMITTKTHPILYNLKPTHPGWFLSSQTHSYGAINSNAPFYGWWCGAVAVRRRCGVAWEWWARGVDGVAVVGWWQCVEARGGGVRVDQVMGSIFGLGRNTCRKSFPAAADGGRRWGGGGRKMGGRERSVGLRRGNGLLGPNDGSCGGKGGRGGSMSGRGGGWLAKRSIVSNEGRGGGGLVVRRANGEDCLDGCDGAGRGKVNGRGVDLGVFKS